MNPSESPSFELPQVNNSPGEAVAETNENSPKPELKTVGSQESLSKNDAASQGSLPPVPQALPAIPNLSTGMPLPSQQVSGRIPSLNLPADDVDLIEKEWVEKAKEVVGATRGDPHAQNNEMNKIKADYIKKRYNKDIKLNEE